MAFTLSGGERVDLSTRAPLRRIFHALVESHRLSPCRAMSVDEVFRAGWGDEVATEQAKAGRVYSGISRLRRLGLDEVIERTAAGYFLEPRCCVIGESLPVARVKVAVKLEPMSFPTRLAS